MTYSLLEVAPSTYADIKRRIQSAYVELSDSRPYFYNSNKGEVIVFHGPTAVGLVAAMEEEARYGWVCTGPDGNWHWSETKPTHELVEDVRPRREQRSSLPTQVSTISGERERQTAPAKSKRQMANFIHCGARIAGRIAPRMRAASDNVIIGEYS